jgi:heptosyltransferase-1
LIVRLGAMGDILHALPAVTALRRAHPEWTIGWAIEPQWRALLAADVPQTCAGRCPQRPLVDRIHLAPAKAWARRPLAPATLRSLLAARRELRAGEYDIAVDLQGAVRSAMLARWARPARLIGEAKPRESAARWLFSERVSTTGTHVIEQAFDVARSIAGDALAAILPDLPFDPAAASWCETAAPEAPFVLLNPGAGWGAKRWPTDRYAAVAAAIADHGLAVAINASPAERPLAEELARLAGGAARVLTPTLGQLIELTRKASLVIAGDTGPLHLASALGRPTVGIFGPTDPARNGPFHGEFRVLRHPGSRRDHTRRTEAEAGLLTITPEAVLEAATALLAGSRE